MSLESKFVNPKICEVIVVPIFASIIIGIAFFNFNISELTNPTAITVVAEFYILIMLVHQAVL